MKYTLIIRGFIAWIFFVAAIAKIVRPESLLWLADALPLFDRESVHVLAYGIAGSEVLLGAALMFTRTAEGTTSTAMALLGAGAIGMTIIWWQGRPGACGCFGALSPLEWLERPVPAITRNFVLFLLLASTFPLPFSMPQRRAVDPTAGDHRVGGFTLAELLVVVGIIALLLAILLPTFARARASARAIHCASGLRNIGQAFNQYIDEHRGAVPRAYIPWRADRRPAWLLVAGPYLNPDQPWPRAVADIEFGESLLGSFEPFHCPSHPLTGQIPGTYIINAFAAQPPWHAGGPVKLASVRSASSVVWVTEAADFFGTSDPLSGQNHVYRAEAHQAWRPEHLPREHQERISDDRHRGNTNVLYFDTSVRASSRGTLTTADFRIGR